MQIRFTKNNSKQYIIRYLRDDGTDTWMRADDYFVHHDLSHYALEKMLGFTHAFNGMINAGMDIHDFEDHVKRNNLQVHDETWYAENMANLFLLELRQGRVEDFNAMQQQAFAGMQKEIKPFTISPEMVNAIRDYLAALLAQWNALKAGQTMELTFDT